jgi:hypothetical protein
MTRSGDQRPTSERLRKIAHDVRALAKRSDAFDRAMGISPQDWRPFVADLADQAAEIAARLEDANAARRDVDPEEASTVPEAHQPGDMIVPRDGVLQGLRVRHGPTSSGDSIAYTVGVNDAPTELAVSVPRGFVGQVDNLTAQIPIHADDRVSLTPSGAGFLAVDQAQPDLEPGTEDLLTNYDVRELFKTSTDVNVVRDCVLVGVDDGGGILDLDVQDHQRAKARARLATAKKRSPRPHLFTRYREYTISSLAHSQPFYVEGRFVHCGYQICSEDGWTNLGPGCCWFMTVAEAMQAVDCLVEAGGSPRAPYERDAGVSARFWALLRALRAREAL